MTLKKLPRYFTLGALTVGASLILGFLSFSGLWALSPVLLLAFAAFGLSVAYEMEIYFQNIRGAFNKLFKHNQLERRLSNEYLLKELPAALKDEKCPQFFKDYDTQRKLVQQFSHMRLNKESQIRKNKAEKTLKDMEKWFATQLFIMQKKDKVKKSDYEQQLILWLSKNQIDKGLKEDEWQLKLNKRRRIFLGVTIFSACAALFMSLGTSYLLLEAFSIIPVLSALPFISSPLSIIPMAAIAGAAYGFMTYNSITDMINNDTLRKWFNKIKDDLKKGITLRSIAIAAMAIFLAGLAIALTICTAGTWWTVAKHTKPLFVWMTKMPTWIMGVINPIFTGLSALVFNLQNTAESLDIIDKESRKGNPFKRIAHSIAESVHNLIARENFWQILNPFRWLLKLTITPLRILLFFGHLIAIGLTADQMPGLPKIASALLGIICEGFEDFHYFIGHSHDHSHEKEGEHKHDHHEHHDHHGCCHHHPHKHDHKEQTIEAFLEERHGSCHNHNHDVDIPTRILTTLAAPIYIIAALWDFISAKKNRVNINDKDKPQLLTFKEAWDKQHGLKEIVNVELTGKQPSNNWAKEQAVYCIERYKEKHLSGAKIKSTLAATKAKELSELQTVIRAENKTALRDIIKADAENSHRSYKTHRFFKNGPTATENFLHALPERVAVAAM